MTRKSSDSQSLVGEDSFLDVIANLVGVLIILVAVVSLQAGRAAKSVDPCGDLKSDLAEGHLALYDEEKTAVSLQTDCEELQDRVAHQARENEELKRLRHESLIQIKIVEQELEIQKAKLSESEKKEFDLMQRREALEQVVGKLKNQLASIQVAPEIVRKEIVHYPTPIAKTVFSNEVHFRLAHGKLAFAPIDSLLQKMKLECQSKVDELTQTPEAVGLVGPDDGFTLEYRLAAEKAIVGGRSGVSVRFLGFVMRPQDEEIGEDLNDAFASGSNFRTRLQRFAPGKTTVSIWVYPDSFKEFMELKTWLRENGFQIAGWPLQDGAFISGGPNGFRTSAQ